MILKKPLFSLVFLTLTPISAMADPQVGPLVISLENGRPWETTISKCGGQLCLDDEAAGPSPFDATVMTNTGETLHCATALGFQYCLGDSGIVMVLHPDKVNWTRGTWE